MLRSLFLATLLVFPARLLSAQDPAEKTSEEILEEIVVSGYRLTSRLESDTSLSIFDHQTIELATTEHFEELVQMVPNMNLSGEGSRARYFQLRGVGEREQYEGAPNPSVAYLIDDIDLSGIGGVASLYDIQQIEILRGPQSTRYGASALAGVVYMRSRDPQAETSANVELTGGNDDQFSLSAAAGGALSPNVNGRISVNRYESDGFRDNTFLGREDSNGRDELSLRGKLGWTFATDWNGLLTGLYMDFDNGYDAWTVNNDHLVHSDHPGSDRQKTRAGSLRLKGPLTQYVDLVSISSIADSDILFSYDGDWGNADFWQQYGEYAYDYFYRNPRQRRSLNQELRLLSSQDGRLFGDTTDWVLGAAWQKLEEDNQISSIGTYDDSGEENYCAPCVTDRSISSRYKARTLALFGSMDSHLTSRLTLSAGLRFELWDAHYDDDWRDVNYPSVPPQGDSCSQFDCRPDANLWGGHLAISLNFKDDLKGYARVARGFKAGGFNPSLAALQGVAVLGPEFVAYRPETLWNYELGLKGSWMDGRISADLALFTMRRKNAQLSQSSQQVPFDPNSFVFVTYNGKARLHGLEASLSWQATSAWELHGSVGLLDSRIVDSEKTAAVSAGAIGRDLAHAPNYTLNLGASFSAGGWFGRLDFNAVDAFYFDISHEQKSSAYQLANLRIGRRWHNWSLSAWGRNIFDEDYATRGFYFGNEPPAFENTLYTKFGDPRTYGISLSYDY